MFRNLKVAHNRFRNHLAYYHRSTFVSGMPKVFSIEINNVCNLRCQFCPYQYMTRKKEFMSFVTFKKIIDEIKETTNFIFLHNFGEPLLHPQLVRFINYASSKGIKVGLSTNCTRLTAEKSIALLKSKLYLIILCVDGATKKTYEMLRKGGNYEKVMNNVDNFLNYRNRLGKIKRVYVQIIQVKENKNEIKKFMKHWENKYPDVGISIKPFDTFGGKIKMKSSLTIADSLKHKQRYPCKWLWDMTVILSNGDVALCCRDYDGKIIIGNVKKNTLKKIWNSLAIRKERQHQINGRFDNGLCNNCPEWIGNESNALYPFSRTFIKDTKKFKYGVD